MSVTVIKEFSKINDILPEWNNWLSAIEYPSPFSTPEWILNWLECNLTKVIPYFLLLKIANEKIGLIPLYLSSRCLLPRHLGYCGDDLWPDPLSIICDPEHRESCVRLARKYLNKTKIWDCLSIPSLFKDEANLWATEGDSIKKVSIAPYLTLGCSFEEYLKTFKKKKRYNLKSLIRKVQENIEYLIIDNIDEKLNCLSEMFILHTKRSENRGINSTFQGEYINQIHRRFIHNFSDVWLRKLIYKGKTAAIFYGFEFNKRLFFYQITHEPELSSISPGRILLYYVIEECCENNIKEFNFLQGDESYKRLWTKEFRSLYKVSLYNNTLKGRLSKGHHVLINSGKTFIRKWTKYGNKASTH